MTPHLRATAAILATAVVMAGAWAAPAGAAHARVLRACVNETRMVSTPGGLVVGFLARGAPVVVLQTTHNRAWSDVLAVHSIAGWVRTHDLC